MSSPKKSARRSNTAHKITKKKRIGSKRKKIISHRIKARKPKTIDQILLSGADAKHKLYESYALRMGKGEILKPSEIKLFRQLESELEAAAGNGGGSGARKNIFISMEEAAEYCGTSKKTISLHIKKGKIRQNADGTFNREELDKWLARYGRKISESGEIESIKEQQEKAELRYRLARAKREEILTAQLEKTLAPWEEIERGWADRVREVHLGLDAFADRLPALLVGRSREEIHRILKSEARELCDRYDREGRYCPECETSTRR